MRHLHLEKSGIRGLAIAESFSQDSKKSVLSGIVMEKLDRSDVSFLLISGIIISLYNMIDVKRISEKIGLPVIAITHDESDGIEDAIKHHFPDSYKPKLAEYSKLGSREKIALHTSHNLYIRNEGCTVLEAKQLLNKITTQGSVPEPLRIAQLLANTLLKTKF